MSDNTTVDWEQMIENADGDDPVSIRQLHDSVRETVLQESADLGSLIEGLSNVQPAKQAMLVPLVTTFAHAVSQRCRTDAGKSCMQDQVPIQRVVSLIDAAATDENVHCQLLRLLAVLETRQSLAAFAKACVEQPPVTETDVLSIFEPLFASRSFDHSALFPDLFGAMHQPKVASAIVDLANYIFRGEMAQTHPIQSRLPEMRKLLAHLTIGLEKIEADPNQNADDPVSIAERVADSSALIVSLCDALALADDQDSVSILQDTKKLAHRRIRAEACAALVRLGDTESKQQLIDLAADASIRMRVLKYAEELELLDEIDPKYQTDVAIAESRLCMWLAQPRQMGIPPTSCELIDHQELSWPGYDEPVECYLFRFVYSLGGQEYSNVGITGPMTYAFVGHLSDLPVDAMYAAFAGWQAEHEEIEQFEISALNQHFLSDVARLERRMKDRGYQEIEPALFGRFFGQNVLIANAVWEDCVGQTVIGSDSEELWFPHPELRTPLTPTEVFNVFKGKQLLRAFNES